VEAPRRTEHEERSDDGALPTKRDDGGGEQPRDDGGHRGEGDEGQTCWRWNLTLLKRQNRASPPMDAHYAMVLLDKGGNGKDSGDHDDAHDEDGEEEDGVAAAVDDDEPAKVHHHGRLRDLASCLPTR